MSATATTVQDAPAAGVCQLVVHLPVGTHHRFKRAATDDGLTMAQVVRDSITRYLAERGKDDSRRSG